MRRTFAIASLSVLVGVLPLHAKDKKPKLPELVTRAKRVMVVIDSSGISLSHPGEDQDARAAVEQALQKWGRFKVVYYGNESDPPDLVIAIRKGGTVKPVLRGGSSPNDRPGTISSSDTGINIGISHGTPPGTTSRTSSDPHPQVATDVGPSEDSFAVYDGRATDPLDMPAFWRYSGKGALNVPAVRAVQEFRKAVEEADKAEQEQKQQKKP